MHVTVLYFDGCSAISSLGAYDLLMKANVYAKMINHSQRNDDLFDITLAGVSKKRVAGLGGVSISTHEAFKNITDTDLVIIPAIDEPTEEIINKNMKAVDWISKMYDAGADIASICTGAFILAETGLVDNKSVTTHWIAEDFFRRRYPKVTLALGNIILDEGRICSSGGASSFLNLVLYLIEKYGSKDLASFCSKIFLVDPNKGNQNSYAIFGIQKNHNDPAILKVQQYIEENYTGDLNVSTLSEQIYVSRRNFIRKFKRATGNTPLEYIQRVRVEAAKRELESSSNTINEIVQNVGYEDNASFRRLFQKYTGLTMSDYRNRYQVVYN